MYFHQVNGFEALNNLLISSNPPFKQKLIINPLVTQQDSHTQAILLQSIKFFGVEYKIALFLITMNIDKYAVIHRQQLEKQIQSTEFQPLPNQPILTYSYKYRYNLKKADQTKSRFCPDPLISKEYERVLYEKFNEY